MVPHSSSIAKRKLIHFSNFADILTAGQQFLGKLARISRIRHLSLNASQKHRLHAMARLFGRQRQQFHCFYTNTCRRQQKDCQRCLVRRPQHQRFLTCAISKCAYNNVRNTFERIPYSAAFLIRTAPHTYRSSHTTTANRISLWSH